MGDQTYLKDVAALVLDVEKCIGCGMCAQVCPHEVFVVSDGKAGIADRDACMECSACARNCPVEAITVRPGVGCAAAVLKGLIRGTEPSCDCGCEPGACCG
jgi:NAD-dependent dihydropyrimidine dehydrogenase PreA subunit